MSKSPGGVWLVRILWVLSLALLGSALLFDVLTPDFLLPVERPGTVFVAASCILSLAGASVGAFVASRLPRNPVGWILCGMCLLYGFWCLTEAYADYALLAYPGLPLGELAAWASTWLRFSMLIPLGVLVTLLFPEGSLPSPRWRIVVWAAGLGAALVALGEATRFGPLLTYYYVNNPFGVGGVAGGMLRANSLTEVFTILGGTLLSVSCLASIGALALRLRLAYGPERQRLEWFAYAAVPALFSSALVVLNWSTERFGLLFFGRTFSPVLGVVKTFPWSAQLGETAGTLTDLHLNANLEFLSACALLMMPICIYVAIVNYGLYGIGGAAKVAASRLLRASLWGTIAGVLPIEFIYLSVYLYVILYPLIGRGELDEEQLGQVASFVSGWGTRTFFIAATFLVAFRVAREAKQRALALGTIVGVAAALVDQIITSIINPPVTPSGVIGYLFLGLAGGYLGAIASRSTLSGGVYLASRQIGKARDASAVASAIGEHLGGKEVNSVSLWQVADPEDKPTPADAYHGMPRREHRSRFTLWGSWRADGQEGWPVGLDPGEVGANMVAAAGERSWALVHRQTLAPEKKRSWERLGIRSALLVPLLTEGGWRGLLMVAFRKRLRFSRRFARAYLTVASQAKLMLENLRLVEEARRTGHQRGILVERQRLAREIHDTLAQGFTGIITNLTAAELSGDPAAVDSTSSRHLEDAKRIARDSLAEARRLVWALRPASLDRYSLLEAVDTLVKMWAERAGVKATLTVDGTPRDLLPEAEVVLLRAVQEALTNVQKHARASTVTVSLTYTEDCIIMEVLDDGDGFDPAEVMAAVGVQDEGRFGLTAMRERVEQLGGKLIVETAPGEGTAIVIELQIIGKSEALGEIR